MRPARIPGRKGTGEGSRARVDANGVKVHSFMLSGHPFHMVGVVKGLRSEGRRTSQLVGELRPDALALGIAPEELEALASYDGEDVPLAGIELAYANQLKKWGEVSLPPPPYLQALRAATKMSVPSFGLDFEEEAYSELYVHHITGLRMIAAGLLEQNLGGKQFRARDAFEFALEWDRAANPTKGHRELELARERRMASEIARHVKSKERLLAIVEHERLDGVVRGLEAAGATPMTEFR